MSNPPVATATEIMDCTDRRSQDFAGVGLRRGPFYRSILSSPIKVPVDTMLMSVRLIATTNDVILTNAIANGRRVPVVRGTELGHPASEFR